MQPFKYTDDEVRELKPDKIASTKPEEADKLKSLWLNDQYQLLTDEQIAAVNERFRAFEVGIFFEAGTDREGNRVVYPYGA